MTVHGEEPVVLENGKALKSKKVYEHREKDNYFVLECQSI